MPKLLITDKLLPQAIDLFKKCASAFIITVFAFFSYEASACEAAKDFYDALQKPVTNCPDDITKLAERAAECMHWGDEAPYDKERAEWIKKSVAKLKCDKIEKDGDNLLKIYNEQPEKQAVIKIIIKNYING